MVSFTALPLETRRQIYSYLLLAETSWRAQQETDAHSLSTFTYIHMPEFATALFITNKQTSEESLTYFYWENAFIAVKIPDIDIQMIRYAQKLFPCVVPTRTPGTESRCRWDAAISTNFTYFTHSTSYTGENFLIFPANRLVDFIHLVDLRLQGCPKFLFTDFKSLRLEETFNKLYMSKKNYTKTFCHPWVDLRSSSRTKDKSDPLRSTMIHQVPVDGRYVFKDCRRLIDLGKNLNNAGCYETAMAYFDLVPEVLGTIEKRWSRWQEYRNLLADAELEAAQNYSDLGFDKFMLIALESYGQKIETGYLGKMKPEEVWKWYTFSFWQHFRWRYFGEARIMLAKAFECAGSESDLNEKKKPELLEMEKCLGRAVVEKRTAAEAEARKREREFLTDGLTLSSAGRNRSAKVFLGCWNQVRKL